MNTTSSLVGSSVNAGSIGTFIGEVVGHVSSVQEEKPVKRELSHAEVSMAVEALNRAMRVVGTKLSFSIDSVTKKPVVRVVDADTQEVIRQIPSEEMLRVSQQITELMGILFDHAA
jgi:flagellar protein FlaG